MGRRVRHRKGWPARESAGIIAAVAFPTLPFKATLSCTLGQAPVVPYPAGVLVAGLVAIASELGLARFTWSLNRTHIEIQTDDELSIEALADIAGLCEAYDGERARAYPS